MNIVARLKEIERRGLLGRLSSDKQARWAEYKRRHPEEFAPLKMTPELRRKAEILAQGLRPQKTFGDKAADWAVNTPLGRSLGFAAQGVANAELNPFGYVARATGVDTNPLEARTAGERAIEKASKYGFDMATAAVGGNLAAEAGYLGAGKNALSIGARALLAPNVYLATAGAGGGGAVEGALNPQGEWEKLGANLLGGAVVSNNPLALLTSGNLTKNLRGGLENVVKNPTALKILHKGLNYGDEALAEDLLNKAIPAVRNLNQKTGDTIRGNLTKRVDIPKAVGNAKERYSDFMKQHASDEIMDFTPSKEQLKAMKSQSAAKPEQLTREEADALLRDRATLQKLGIYNDEMSYTPNAVGERLGIQHMLDDDRRSFIGTLNDTMNNPDLTFTQDGKDYYMRKYTNSETGKDFYDFAFKKGNELFDKYPKGKPNGIVKQLKEKTTQNMSLSGNVSQATGRGTNPLTNETINNITPKQGYVNSGIFEKGMRDAVANPDLPNVSTLYDGLNEFQRQQLNEVLKRGLNKTNLKAGSLESMNEVKKELNDIINSSMQTNPNNQLFKNATNDTHHLFGIKDKLNNVLNSSGLKNVDRQFARAKRLDEVYNQGRRFNPNSVNNDELLPSLSPLENNAFTQGLFNKITHNPAANKNLANEALNYEVALSKILPKSQYNKLIPELNRQKVQYNRLTDLGSKAERMLRTPEKEKFFGREQLESKGSMFGTAADLLYGKIRGGIYRKAAKDLLNPNFAGRSDTLWDNNLYLLNDLAQRYAFDED